MRSQEEFLAKVRRALGKEAAAEKTPLFPPATSWLEAEQALRQHLGAQRPQLVARLQQEISAVGGQVFLASSAAAATDYIAQVVRNKEAKLVVRWPAEIFETLEIDAVLQQLGVSVEVTTPPSQLAADETAAAVRRQELRQILARADIGLSGVDWAIAETGTLVLAASSGQMRSVSLLPPVHIAVVRLEQVVATLADCLVLVQAQAPDLQEALTSCMSLVTGPSRSGDIELTLTIGVHGPGEVHVIILDAPREQGGRR